MIKLVTSLLLDKAYVNLRKLLSRYTPGDQVAKMSLKPSFCVSARKEIGSLRGVCGVL